MRSCLRSLEWQRYVLVFLLKQAAACEAALKSLKWQRSCATDCSAVSGAMGVCRRALVGKGPMEHRVIVG